MRALGLRYAGRAAAWGLDFARGGRCLYGGRPRRSRPPSAAERRGAASTRLGFVDDRFAEESEFVVERAHDAAPFALGLAFRRRDRPALDDALFRKEAAHGIEGCAPLASHSTCLLLVDDDRSRLGARIVVPEDLDESPVARRVRVGNDETVGRLFLRAHRGAIEYLPLSPVSIHRLDSG